MKEIRLIIIMALFFAVGIWGMIESSKAMRSWIAECTDVFRIGPR